MKNRQNLGWLALVALAALLFNAAPGAAFVTNMTIGVNGVQGFETYPGMSGFGSTNYADGWALTNSKMMKWSSDINRNITYQGSNSVWMNNVSFLPWIQTPLISNGVGSITFFASSSSALNPTESFAFETSSDAITWVTNSTLTTNIFHVPTWLSYTQAINLTSPIYLRLHLTSNSSPTAQTYVDNLVLSYPQATVAFTTALPSPNPPNVNNPFNMTVTVVPDGLVSNTTVTNFWSNDGGSSWNPIGMVTNGVNTWITTNAIPGQSAITIQYYFIANFQGPDAVSPFNSATNEFTVQAPAYISGYNQDSFRVQGDLNTNLWLVGNSNWLGVVQSSAAVTNALVKFFAETTNQPPTTNIWGDVAQVRTLFRIDGTASTNGTDIVIGGTNSGAFIFTFVETNLAYSIDHGVYQSFDAWTPGSMSNAGWTSLTGLNFGDANHSYRGQSAQLPTNGWVMTPLLSQGIGQICFWYRNNSSNGLPATACSVQKSLDGATWTTLTNLAVNNNAYQRFALTVEDRNSRYVRLLNGTNEQLCLDDAIVTDPFWAGVTISTPTITPANPTATNAVTISATITPAFGTSNLIATLYYRSGSTGAYSTLAMTNSGTTFSNSVAIAAGFGPDGGAGLVQYFIGCTFQGYNSNLTSPAYYPPDTNNPSGYSIARSYLVLTNAATIPVAPNTTNAIALTLDILPFAAASNVSATAFYSIASATGPFTALGMATTGGNHFATTTLIPAQPVPGTMLYYYFTANSAGANPLVPTNYPAGGAAAPLAVQIHAAPFSSAYTNLVVTGGGLAPGMILVSNGLWQGVMLATNLLNPGFVFTGQNSGGTTNFGAATQPIANFPFFGTASGGAGNIVLYGTNNGPLVFSFDENSHAWSVLRAAYVNFDTWTNGTAGYGTYTNSDDWVLTDGRVTSNSAPDTALAFVNRSGILNAGSATNQSLRSLQLTNGIGQISFWYRNAQTNGVPAAGFTVEVAPDPAGPWTTVAAVSNLLSSDYLYFTAMRSDRVNGYVRIRNLTTSNHPAVCLDEVIVAEPGAGVAFSAVTNTPAVPTATNGVTVSAVITPLAGASNLIATLYYRGGSTGAYTTLAMTNSGATFSNSVAIPSGIGPDGGAGLVQYFIGCTFQGYNGNLASPAYYPPDTNNPSGYSIARSYLVLTNAATIPVAPNTANTITLTLDILPFAAASNVTATAYYSFASANGPFTALGMTSTGGNHFATTTPIPAQSVPGTMLYYYFTANSAGANPLVPTNYPAGGATAPLAVQIHAAPFTSAYTNLVVTGGGLAPGMILVGNGLWQGVTLATNQFNPGFVFTGQNGGTTNFGAATQPITNFPFFGTASGGAGNIVLYGTNNGPLVFSFDETNHTWSVLRADYVNFDVWTNGTGGYGTYTNSDNWVLTDGRVTSNSAPDTALAFVNRSGILNAGPATNQSLRSPHLTNGIGQISFWYRNAQTNGVPAAGFTVDVAPDPAGPWATVAAVSNLLSGEYRYFTITRSDQDNGYVRIRNLTTSNHPALCLDEVIVAEPGAGVAFSAVTNTPAAPTFLDNVYISGILTPLNGATGISAGVFYRDNTNAAFEFATMATTGGNYYVTTTNLYPTGPSNSVQYYLVASYGGFQAASSSPAQYPAAGQPMLSYLVYDRAYIGDRVQGFETYPGMAVFGSTNYADGWALTNSKLMHWTSDSNRNITYQGSNSVWMNIGALGPWIQSLLLSNGVGSITFFASSSSALNPTESFAFETSSNGITWVTNSTLTAQIFQVPTWLCYTQAINVVGSNYLRLQLTSNSAATALTYVDNIVIGYPPALVSVTNVIVEPGYPSTNAPVFVACDVASISQPYAAFGISPKLWYRIGGVTNGPITMNPIGGVRYRSATAIPTQPVNTRVEYSIQVDFSGYYGSDAEKKSPFYYPGGPRTQSWTNYFVRRGGSSYGELDVVANNLATPLDLISAYQWQGVFTIDTLTNQVAINLQGLNPYTNGATRYGQTITLGDATQWRTNPPLSGIAQAGGSAFTMSGALQGSYVFQYNEQSGQYVLRACVYQDFNNGWPVSDPKYAFGSADNTPAVKPNFSLWGTNTALDRPQTFTTNPPATWAAMDYSRTTEFKNIGGTFWGANLCAGPTTNDELQTTAGDYGGYLVLRNNNGGNALRGVGTVTLNCRTTNAVPTTVGLYLCHTNDDYDTPSKWIGPVTNYVLNNNSYSGDFQVHTSAIMSVILAHDAGYASVLFKRVNVSEWYADTRTVGVSRVESFAGLPWTTVTTYTNSLISSATEYGIFDCQITSASGVNWAETVATNNQGYVVQANRDLGLVGVGTLQATASAPSGDAGLAIYLAPLGQYTNRASWGSPVWSGLITNTTVTNIQVTLNRATNAAIVFAHTTGDAPLLMSALTVTSYDATNAWVAGEVWMESNTVSQCRMEASRADAGAGQYLRTPLVRDRAVQIAVTWLAGDITAPAAFDVYATPGNNSTTWGTNKIASVSGAFTNQQQFTYNLPLDNSTNLFFWLVNTSSNNGVLIVRDFVVTRARSTSLWLGNNVDVVELPPSDSRTFNLQTCFMNSNTVSDVVATGGMNSVLSDVAPFVQTPMLPNGIGEVSFWYRNWAASGVPAPAMLKVLASPTGGTNDLGWTLRATVTNIVNTNDYLYFTYSNFDTSNHYLRIQNNTNPAAGGVGRVALDNIIVVVPTASDVTLTNLTISPRIPIYTNTVDVTITLTNSFLFPSNIQVTAYYQTATNYGGWSGATNSLAMGCIASNTAANWSRYQTISPIPALPVDTFVKYWVGATFDGYLSQSTVSRPTKIDQEFVTPTWYYPVDFGVSNAYYIVYSCPTGAVWINEFNVVDYNHGTDWQFVELAGRNGTAIGNWHIESYPPNNASTPDATFTLTNSAALHSPTNGYGFWVMGMSAITPRDMTFDGGLPPYSGGIALKRSFGAIEDAVCYAFSPGDVSVLTDNGFTYAGSDDFFYNMPLYLYGDLTNGLNWSNVTADNGYTPGAANPGENFPPLPLPLPNTLTSAAILNIWLNTNVWIVCTGTNGWAPTPWYATNLALQPISWTNVPAYASTYPAPSNGPYTVNFPIMTNAPVYFYKIVTTNSAP